MAKKKVAQTSEIKVSASMGLNYEPILITVGFTIIFFFPLE